MKHIVSFSGGMGSFAEAYYCVQEFGKDNVILLFADTKEEDSDLYRFLEETREFLGCELVKLAYGPSLWELFKIRKFIGTNRVDICSETLKRDLLNGWIYDNYGIIIDKPILNQDGSTKKNTFGEDLTIKVKSLLCEVHLGIDFSEHHRLTRVQKYMSPAIYRSLLVERGLIIAKDFSEQFGIRKPFLYTLNFAHNNCGGFCVKSGLGQFKKLYEELPERYAYHEQQERETIALGAKPFLRMQKNNKKRYLTMEEYRVEFLEVDKAEEFTYDYGGCGCALPMGE